MEEKLSFRERMEIRLSQNKAFYQEKNRAMQEAYRRYEISEKKEEIHKFIYATKQRSI